MCRAWKKSGPKTAVKWLAQYGSLDGVVAHAQEIGGVVGENLRRALPWLPQAKKLLTVYCDVPLPVKPAELVPATARRVGNHRFVPALRLQELAERSGAGERHGIGACATSGTEPEPDPIERRYDTLLDERQLADWLQTARWRRSGRVRYRDHRPRPFDRATGGHVFLRRAGRAAYLPLAHNYPARRRSWAWSARSSCCDPGSKTRTNPSSARI